MKRLRDEDMMTEDCNVGMTPPPSSLWVSMSPWKPRHASVKRCRDRSVPVDAMSRMMSAAITNARIKKHSSIGQLFGVKSKTPRASCTVCDRAGKPVKPQLVAVTIKYCSHCERTMGDCCQRECILCCNIFCPLCSTLNCDEQFDRVFCLSCNQEQSRN
ncbi:unnamed protein product [Peronospora farinosa]|uniref:Uncharacterized protein n=1 Tax=Peronospora farinosa TaxID=134698 RepID=A0AAV0U5M3_9STRA|nr:unnamed protein product [Peronospora farinosa]CAI5732074.1 unnamed protein product [Peronospora farinosa]